MISDGIIVPDQIVIGGNFFSCVFIVISVGINFGVEIITSVKTVIGDESR